MAASTIRNQNPQERVAKAIAGDPNGPYACPRCGSTFFSQQNAYQQSVSGYGVRIISISPQAYHACIGCGEPLVPKNLQNMANKGGEREAFIESVELGKNYRDKQNASNLVKNTASISEVERLNSELERLQDIVNGLIEHLASLDEEIEEIAAEEAKTPEVEQKPEKITRKNASK